MKTAAKDNNHWERAARVFRRCSTTSLVATIVVALLWSSVLAAEQATTENAEEAWEEIARSKGLLSK